MIVVDASVVYKWVVDEQDEATRRAVKLRNTYLAKREKVVAPDILLYEIGNIFAYKTKLSPKDISKAWQSFLLLDIPTVSATASFITGCLTVSRKYAISVYDAAYVELAREKKCRLITADTVLVKRVHQPFVRSL
ncbi:type II toxin-antitoxin system VapC family toxin [Patescibacteria group bacterium]|nr:type II toxin-antitoxin system VapC family toxin [Patescibacteria group bacterium]